MNMIHIVASDLYTIMYIFNELKGKRVICYNGGAHSAAIHRFLQKYYESSYKKYGVPRSDRIDVKCLFTPGLSINGAYKKNMTHKQDRGRTAEGGQGGGCP
jgi:hypothetical protein